MANIKARLNPQKNITVSEYRLNTGNVRLSDLLDVDTSNASDGSFLLYNGDQQKFEATTELDNNNTNINGGHY